MEKTMEAAQEKPPEAAVEPTPELSVTAKQMAAAEEINAARLVANAKAEALKAALADVEEPSIVNLAAQGQDALHEALRAHRDRPKPEYAPPPRTERQMSALQEELEAGRRAQQKAEAQQANRPVEKSDLNKEGFTTPVYRPGDMVPDPMLGNGKHGNGVYAQIKADAP
jgi:hypothetical protein